MKIIKLVSWISLLLIVSTSCSLFAAKTLKVGLVPIDLNKVIAEIPTYDPAAPPRSPGAAALRALAVIEPGVSILESDVEAAEQAALIAGTADLQALMPVSSTSLELASLTASPFGTSAFMIPSPSVQPTNGGILLVGYNPPDVIQSADGGLSAASVIGLISSMFTDIFNIPAAFPTKSFTQTETKGDATTNMTMEMGRSEDGSNHFGLGLKSEGTKNGVSVKTDLSATIDGQRCPNTEGQVSFSIKGRIGSESGGTGTTQDLTTFVRVIVNDGAEIASSTFDVIQGTRQAKGGRQVYMESGGTFKFGPEYTEGKVSNGRLIRNSQNVTQEDINNLEPAGIQAALDLGMASLASAQVRWQGGGCVKIVAASPGTVKAGSTTAIPVNVISIFEGSNVPSKIKAALTGAQSIDPTSLAKTPGTLTYTAPGEIGKSATILLTATSKRGKAKLELTANTGGAAYRVSGESNQVSFSGEICSLEKPFVIDATFPGGGSAKTSFTPSNSTGGVTSVSGGGGDCVQTGAGTYTVTLKEDGSGSIKWTTTDTLTCPKVENTRTGTFELPLVPAPEISCP